MSTRAARLLEFKSPPATADDVTWLLANRRMWDGWPDSKAYVFERDAHLIERFRRADGARWTGQNEAVFRRMTMAVWEARRRLRARYVRIIIGVMEGE
jgi:hypothetical protein